MRSRKLIISVFLFVFSGFLASAFELHAFPPVLARAARKGMDLKKERAECIGCVADFALYDPDVEDDGVWEEEITALKAMFDLYGFTYQRINFNAINAGELGSGSARRYKALIAPGGYAPYRLSAITPSGNVHIREFISSGGNYVGFCAGAYWAAQTVRWSQTGNGYVDYPYPLKLFPGVAQGPLAWMPWQGGTNINFDQAAVNLKNPTMAAIEMPAQIRFLYGGGPWFVPSGKMPSGYEVWARAVAPSGETRTDGDQMPTVIRFKLGTGNVVLFSYHPDVLIGSAVDRVKLRQYYQEDQIRWNLGNFSQSQINIASWNIVHAALQIAAEEKPTPVKSLPVE